MREDALGCTARKSNKADGNLSKQLGKLSSGQCTRLRRPAALYYVDPGYSAQKTAKTNGNSAPDSTSSHTVPIHTNTAILSYFPTVSSHFPPPYLSGIIAQIFCFDK